MAFGGIETGLRALGIPDPSKIALGIQREYDFNRIAELSPERRLDPETIKNLERRGWFVCTLTGKTPEDISNIRPTEIDVNVLLENFEVLSLPSKITQVAFAPKTLFLPKSNNMTLEYQKDYLEYFNNMVQKEMPQVKAVNGSVADWVEAIFRYFSATRKRIFSKRHGFNYTTTSTISSEGLVLDVGGVVKKDCTLSIDINQHDPEKPLESVSLAPMLVPASLET